MGDRAGLQPMSGDGSVNVSTVHQDRPALVSASC